MSLGRISVKMAPGGWHEFNGVYLSVIINRILETYTQKFSWAGNLK